MSLYDSITPFIGMAPMDGITDAAFRYMIDHHGKPDILMTEFVPVEAIQRGVTSILSAFISHKTQTPMIAQLLGADSHMFYNAFFVCAECGFDGLDINMGCPDTNVLRRKAGGAFIKDKKLADSIIQSVISANNDWSNGKKIADVDLPDRTIQWVKTYQTNNKIYSDHKKLSLSIKTRIGFQKSEINDWILFLCGFPIDCITVHGRTVTQRYSGFADWGEIAKAAEIIHGHKIIAGGNGDIKSMEEARQKIKEYGVDGVLVGRAVLGNPWFFSNHSPTQQERIEAMLEHCRVFSELTPQIPFITMRKHLAWYYKGFENAASTRDKLMKVQTYEDVLRIFKNHK